MTYESITYEKRGRVAVVTLNRPASMNALHLEAHLELKDAWEATGTIPMSGWPSSPARATARSAPATT